MSLFNFFEKKSEKEIEEEKILDKFLAMNLTWIIPSDNYNYKASFQTKGTVDDPPLSGTIEIDHSFSKYNICIDIVGSCRVYIRTESKKAKRLFESADNYIRKQWEDTEVARYRNIFELLP